MYDPIMTNEPNTTSDRATRAEALRAQANDCDRKAAESFDRCDTDGFLSQWANGITGQQLRAQARIEENGGTMTFARTIVVDADGNDVGARQVHTRYGYKWRIDSRDLWVAYNPTGSRGLAKYGLSEVDVIEVGPAKAIIEGTGKGLAGAASCYVRIVRTDRRPSEGWHLHSNDV